MNRNYQRTAILLATVTLMLALAGTPASASAVDDVTNYRNYSELLASSGQPQRSEFDAIKEAGFERVIFLAPYDSQGSFEEEADIVEGLGIEYVHIPMLWDRPQASEFDAMVAAIRRDPGKKTLIHCQLNYRASSMSFLYRVIHADVDIAEAKDDLDSVWVPNGTWRQYIFEILEENGHSPDCDTCLWDAD